MRSSVKSRMTQMKLRWVRQTQLPEVLRNVAPDYLQLAQLHDYYLTTEAQGQCFSSPTRIAIQRNLN